jgi:glutathione S-transferase
VEGEFKLWESGAILLYLAEKYDRPPASPEAKAELTQWVFFANATLGPGIFIESSRERETPRLLQPLDDIFAQQSFLTGEDFTVADVAIGSSLAYIQMMLKIDYSPYPHIQSYLQRIGSRPAFQNTIAKRN